MLSSWAHSRHQAIGAQLPGFVFTYSHWWQLSEMMQIHLSRGIQGCLFIKARVKMKGPRVTCSQRRVQSQTQSSALYGDRSKIMSTENSPWERITESSISLPYCCFWLRLTRARMKCLKFLWREEPNACKQSSTCLKSWDQDPQRSCLLIVFALFCLSWLPFLVKGCCCHFCSFLMPAKSLEVSAVISLNWQVKYNNCRTSPVQPQGLI